MREISRSLLKRLKNVPNSNINGKHALPVDRKDIKVCFGGKKSKSSDIIVQCLYSCMVFSRNKVCQL